MSPKVLQMYLGLSGVKIIRLEILKMQKIDLLIQKLSKFITKPDKRVLHSGIMMSFGMAVVIMVCLTSRGVGRDEVKKEVFCEKALENLEKSSDLLENENESESMDFISINNFGSSRASLTPVNQNMLGMSAEGIVGKSDTTEAVTTEAVTEPATEVSTAAIEVSTEASTEAVTEPATEVATEPVTETVTQAVTQAPVEAGPVLVQTSVNIDVTEDDYYWFTKIVEAEAGDQDMIGRILVANVIINRVCSGQFPGSISAVIFQNNGRTYQFEPVKNGRIYNMNPSAETVEAVNRALSGEDYSQGALYFTMKTSSSSWFNRKLELLFVHGDHYFYTN